MSLWTAIPKSKKIGWGLVARPTKTKPQTHQLWNEAQLNCVALRSSLDDEVAWRPVKGQDERQKTAPLTALHATGRSAVDLEEKNMEGRHVGLDFYDLLIEAVMRRSKRPGHCQEPARHVLILLHELIQMPFCFLFPARMAESVNQCCYGKYVSRFLLHCGA